MANRLEIIISARGKNLAVLNKVGLAIRKQKADLAGLNELSAQYAQVGRRQVMVAGGIAAGMAACVKPAAEFSQGMRNVNSIVKANEGDFRKMRAAVVDIARDPLVTDMPATLAEGLYDIHSSGIEGQTGLDVLKVASKGASAGLTDTATSARVLTAVMNAYNRKTGKDSADIMDVLFKTVDRGVVTFDELAQHFSMASTTAAAAGVSLEHVAAGMMTMTKQGHDAAISATALNRIIMSFMSPNKNLLALMKEHGYESGLQILRQRGLAGAVEWLTEATDGQADAMVSVLGEMRSVRAALALTGTGAQMFAEDLEAVKDHAGAMGTALEEQSKGAMFQWKLMLKDITITATEFGDVLLPMLRSMSGGVRTVAEWFGKLPGPIKKTMVATGLLTMAGFAYVGMLNLAKGAMVNHMLLQQLMQTNNLKSAGTFAFLKAMTLGWKASLLGAIPAIKGIGVALKGALLGPLGLVLIAGAAAIALVIRAYKMWKSMRDAQAEAKVAEKRLEDFEKKHGVLRDPKTGAVLAINRGARVRQRQGIIEKQQEKTSMRRTPMAMAVNTGGLRGTKAAGTTAATTAGGGQMDVAAFSQRMRQMSDDQFEAFTRRMEQAQYHMADEYIAAWDDELGRREPAPVKRAVEASPAITQGFGTSFSLTINCNTIDDIKRVTCDQIDRAFAR